MGKAVEMSAGQCPSAAPHPTFELRYQCGAIKRMKNTFTKLTFNRMCKLLRVVLIAARKIRRISPLFKLNEKRGS